MQKIVHIADLCDVAMAQQPLMAWHTKTHLPLMGLLAQKRIDRCLHADLLVFFSILLFFQGEYQFLLKNCMAAVFTYCMAHWKRGKMIKNILLRGQGFSLCTQLT